ncbi:MAG: AAA family ATPase [Deltaproteobacteria bacterium]|nr:AAA family ATPase [Deltaproteobacteria bacterium]
MTTGAAARFVEQMDLLIRARYPVLYVVTHEEARLESLLADLARRQGKPLSVWTATRGLAVSQGARSAEAPRPVTAAEVLDRIRSQEGAGLFLLRDLHAFFEDPLVVRRLRDLAGTLEDTRRSVVISAPRLTLPPELEKDVTVLDLPLPEPDELRALLRSLCEQLHDDDPKRVQIGREDAEALVRAAQGLTLAEAENAFARAAVTDGALRGVDVALVLAEKCQAIRKSGMLEFHPAETTLADVGGLVRLKDWLRRRGKALDTGAREFGLPPARGVLLLGAPGCGKSLTAKVVANAWKIPLLHLDLGRVFSGLLGSSEENMRRALRVADGVAPAVLWIDEIEKGLAGGTGRSGEMDGGTAQRVFGSLLTWMSEQTSGVFVVATANRIESLPPELLRRGRFDEVFFVDLPDTEARAEILAIHLRRRGRDPAGFDLVTLAEKCAGFSGAEIEHCVVEGLYAAFDLGHALTTEDLARAIAETTPLSVTSAEEIERMRTWASSRARPADAPRRSPTGPALPLVRPRPAPPRGPRSGGRV